MTLKPVIQTTLRPPTSTLKIVLEKSKIQATGGHRWWVSGKGWIKTRDLRKGMVLHSATGTTAIKDVIEDLQEQQTYNLVVDGLHTYFVGPERVMSYDNADVKPIAA
jgi:hypothetical protein